MEARVLVETLHHGINITVFGDKVRVEASREPDPIQKHYYKNSGAERSRQIVPGETGSHALS